MKPKQFLKLSLVTYTIAILATLTQHTQASALELDQNFSTPFFATPVLGSRAVVLPNGKYVMFFNLDTLEEQSTGSIMRFNSDGSLDSTFTFTHDYSGTSAGIAVAPNGQLIIGATKTVYGVALPFIHTPTDILRLNSDGSIDSTFGPAQVTEGGDVRAIVIQPDGKILVCGTFTAFNGTPRQGIVRLNSDGTLDNTFATITLSGTHALDSRLGGHAGLWCDPALQKDVSGSLTGIFIAGDFEGVSDGTNSISCAGVARLYANGMVDTTFQPSGFIVSTMIGGVLRPIRGIGIQSDGRIVIGGRFNGPPNRIPLVRLNTDGSRDAGYAAIDGNTLPPDGLLQQIRGLIIQADDKVIAIGRSIWRFNTDGSLDSSFNNVALLVQQQFDTAVASGEAFNIAAMTGGGFFIGGVFTDIDDASGPPGPEYWGAAKLHSDGTLDTSFTTSHREGFRIEPGIFTRDTDGSVRIAFNSLGYDTFHPAIPHNLGRLLSSGTLDSTFDPLAALNPTGPLGPNFQALGFTGLSDGSLLVTGLDGNTANYGHLLPNGSEDTNYNANPHTVFATAFPRSDNKVVLSGYNNNFQSVSVSETLFGFPDDGNVVDYLGQGALQSNQVQRIMPDGSLDPNFHLDPLILADLQQRDQNGNLTAVYVGSGVLALTANNTILFGYLSKDGSYHLVRLNDDGSLDTSFGSPFSPSSPGFTGETFQVSTAFYSNWVIDPQNLGLFFVPIYYPVDIPVKEAKAVLDNKVVLMGSFANYGGTSAHGMLRIFGNTTTVNSIVYHAGDPDPSFNVGGAAQWIQTQPVGTFQPSIDNLEVGLDDKLLLTGTFEAFNGTAAPGIISLNPDGTIDTSFTPPVKRQKLDYQPAYLARQSDGSFLLSGPYSKTTDNNSPSFFRLLLPPGVPTPTATPGATPGPTSVDLGSPIGSGGTGASDVMATFSDVNTAGTTSVSLINPDWAGQLPPGFQIAGANLAFEVYTTASYTGPVTVCFTLPSLDPAIFAAADLWHNNGSGLVKVTTSKDSTTQTICGTVPSLSPFVVLTPPYIAKIQPPINANGSSIFSVKQGSVAVKFTLTSNGVPTCKLPAATISLLRTAGTAPGPIPVSKYQLPSDSGSNFRVDTANCQYVYNLGTSSLGTGTYKVNITVGGTVIGSGTFGLK